MNSCSFKPEHRDNKIEDERDQCIPEFGSFPGIHTIGTYNLLLVYKDTYIYFFFYTSNKNDGS